MPFRLRPTQPLPRRVRRRLSSLEAHVRAVLRADGGRIDLLEIESIAMVVYQHPLLPVPGELCSPWWLLRVHRLGFRVGALPGTAGAALLGDVVIHRAWPDLRLAIPLLHEFAHWLLRGRPHDERDVWLLTLALVMPGSILGSLRRTTRRPWAAQRWCPRWAVDLRRTMLRWVNSAAA